MLTNRSDRCYRYVRTGRETRPVVSYLFFMRMSRVGRRGVFRSRGQRMDGVLRDIVEDESFTLCGAVMAWSFCKRPMCGVICGKDLRVDDG